MEKMERTGSMCSMCGERKASKQGSSERVCALCAGSARPGNRQAYFNHRFPPSTSPRVGDLVPEEVLCLALWDIFRNDSAWFKLGSVVTPPQKATLRQPYPTLPWRVIPLTSLTMVLEWLAPWAESKQRPKELSRESLPPLSLSPLLVVPLSPPLVLPLSPLLVLPLSSPLVLLL